METAQKEIRSNLQTAGQIFKTDFKYKVPPHQRNFSWTLDEVEQLWEDLYEAIQEDRSEYFMGTIVVQEDRESKIRTIIDGQQRLATLTMIFSAIRAVYHAKDDDRDAEIYMEYLGMKDRRTRDVESRLTLNELNDRHFKRLVIDNIENDDLKAATKDKAQGQSNLLLSRAAQFIRSAIQNMVRDEKNFENYLIELEEFIANRVVLICVVVGDEADAYLIFETLNDRGLELSISDLLKNYVFGRAGNSLMEVRRQWDEIALLLGDRNITQFLRHYWLSKYGVVRERDLYKAMKQKFVSKNAVLRIITELRDAADKYAAIFSADHSLWEGYSTNCMKDLNTLQLFNISQFRPLILASLDVMTLDQVQKVVHIIVIVSIRYSIIGSLGTGNIEKAYSDASISVRNKEADTPAKVFSLLNKICPDDTRFKEDFSQKSIGKSNLARYILSCIVNEKESNKVRELIRDETKITLEHIMPKTRNQNWLYAAESEEEYNEHVNRLGNLTLMEKSINRAAGSISFLEKKEQAYSLSEITLNKELCNYSVWTVSEIECRQKDLADIALKVWSLPY